MPNAEAIFAAIARAQAFSEAAQRHLAEAEIHLKANRRPADANED